MVSLPPNFINDVELQTSAEKLVLRKIFFSGSIDIMNKNFKSQAVTTEDIYASFV